MATRGVDGRRMETDHEKGAVRHLASEFNHAGPSGQQIDRRRRHTSVPETGHSWTELDAFPGEQLPKIHYRFPHDGHWCARLPYTPWRNESGGHSETGAPRRDLL